MKKPPSGGFFIAALVARHLELPRLPPHGQHQYFLLQPQSVCNQMREGLCQQLVAPACHGNRPPGDLASADLLPLQTADQRAGIVLNIRHQSVGQPERQRAMEGMGQFGGDIQSPLIQIAKVGLRHSRRQQREHLPSQPSIAARHIEQQLPRLQRVVHEGPLVLHRHQLPSLPLDAL